LDPDLTPDPHQNVKPQHWKKGTGTVPGMTLVALGNLILILEREVQPNLAPLRLHLFQLFLLRSALHAYPNSKEIIRKNLDDNLKVCASSDLLAKGFRSILVSVSDLDSQVLYDTESGSEPGSRQANMTPPPQKRKKRKFMFEEFSVSLEASPGA
jgi:hypothetical protein